MKKKEKKYRYKTVTIDDSLPYESNRYRELEKMLEEDGWEIYQSGVNTILKETRGYTHDNNITRFILRKEKED